MEEQEKRKVVAADDEAIIRVNLEEMLQNLGFQVCASASDGFEAIEACREWRPDIVLLDVKMPVLDGLAAAHFIYENNLAETIILVTAYSDQALVEKAIDLSVSGYLVKPISENSLLPGIRIAQAKSREIAELKQDVEKAEADMAARKVLEKAKGILMEREGLSEQKAYEYIRNLSKKQSISMAKVAEILLASRD